MPNVTRAASDRSVLTATGLGPSRATAPFRERAFAAGIPLVALLITAFVQHVARPYAQVAAMPDFGILTWLPSFLTAAGLPFIWLAVGRRFTKSVPAHDFLLECFVTTVALVNHEVWQIRDPSHVFDWRDLLATLAGSLAALFLYRYLSRGMLRNLAASRRRIP